MKIVVPTCDTVFQVVKHVFPYTASTNFVKNVPISKKLSTSKVISETDIIFL